MRARAFLAAACLLAATSSGGCAHGAPPVVADGPHPSAAPASAPSRTRLAVEGTAPTTTSARPPVSARASRSRTTVRPRVVAPPTAAPRPAVVTNGSVWDAIAACESHGNWSINTGNGYYGGLQENMGFWTTYDGMAFAARPDLASREQQITVAERARDGYTNTKGEHYKARGYTPWPHCGRRFR